VKNDLSKSVFYLNEAIRVDDHQIPAVIGLATVYEEAGEKKLALDTYLKLLELDPNNQEALSGIDRLSD
jgi:Tfp pilus assembly protein PilF